MSADIVADTDCIECTQGKHVACTGGSWDQTTDAPGACPCWVGGHTTDEPPQELVDRLDQITREALVVVRKARTPEEVEADSAADREEAARERQWEER